MSRCPGIPEDACGVIGEDFDSLSSRWKENGDALEWHCPFVLPPWLKAWWTALGAGWSPCLLGVRQGEDLIGIAPLRVKGREARFIGDPEVCDYLDFAIVPGRGPAFFRALIEELRRQGVRDLDLWPVRQDSTVLRELLPAVKELECEASLDRVDVSYELALPDTWEAYLEVLKGAERHEVRRKLRRLEEAGRIEFRTVVDPQEVVHAMDAFLRLFGGSRPDKEVFLTDRRERFFRSLAEAMAGAGLLKLSFLELDAQPAAAVMCFQDRSTVYLYNNGYDIRFRLLSVGFLSKVFSIQEAIREGKKRFDFLKGSEDYKRRLGGKPVPLYRCRLRIF